MVIVAQKSFQSATRLSLQKFLGLWSSAMQDTHGKASKSTKFTTLFKILAADLARLKFVVFNEYRGLQLQLSGVF